MLQPDAAGTDKLLRGVGQLGLTAQPFLQDAASPVETFNQDDRRGPVPQKIFRRRQRCSICSTCQLRPAHLAIVIEAILV